jgi:hypothetical protein
MISIKLNKELDCEVYGDFRNFSIGGVDFGKMIREDHPSITPNKHKEYIEGYYRIHSEEISNSLIEINSALRSKEFDFNNFVKFFFGSLSINNEYSGYLSIFNCNPRYLDKKIFQIYFKKDLSSKLEVCWHESLHFQFFDYCDKYLNKETTCLDKNSGKLWALSEVFNVILMNEPDFRNISDREEKLFYPELKEKLAIAQKTWCDSGKNISEFIKKYLTVV